MPDSTFAIGYASPLEVHPGQTVRFHLSSSEVQGAAAQVVKVRCGDPDPNGPGVSFRAMPTPLDGAVALRQQPIYAGSYGVVEASPALRALRSFSIACWAWPTLISAGRQTLMAHWCEQSGEGWHLDINEKGRLELTCTQGGIIRVATTVRALLEREWVLVGGSFDALTGRLSVFQRSLDTQGGRDCSSHGMSEGPVLLPASAQEGLQRAPLTFAARLSEGLTSRRTIFHFNGKIDRPRLHAQALNTERLEALCATLRPLPQDIDLVGAWDFSEGIGTTRLVDLGPHRLHGEFRNTPTRAVTGANWTGRRMHWTEVPDEYGAVHFHDDDMDDCRWDVDLSLEIPTDWPSGFYALRLTAPGTGSLPGEQPRESYVSFFVGATCGAPTAKLAFVASTATFLAYSNSAMRLDFEGTEAMQEQLLVIGPDEVYLQEHRELGLSTYDTHTDGSGVCHVSGARPLLNVRPYGGNYYSMDTRVLDWLDELGLPYDVITDEAIHRHGSQLLRGYTCVMTGCHPEYYTESMLNAFEVFQGQGGRHVYLGGNGFYWRAAFHPEMPSRLEIRRGMAGTRVWEGEAGENGLASTGEPSGLWRSNGRPPQRLVGVGFDAQVFDRGSAYRRLPGSYDARVAFIFDGVGEQEVIGDFGLRGGAAGHETDRVDHRLGSPPQLLLLATADDIGSGGLATPEELGFGHRGIGGDQNAQIRADMVFFPTARGGAVFATGSIAWGMALAHSDYNNNVSRITANVLRRFVDPAPFEGFEAVTEGD